MVTYKLGSDVIMFSACVIACSFVAMKFITTGYKLQATNSTNSSVVYSKLLQSQFSFILTDIV